jgi:hypothetical protein
MHNIPADKLTTLENKSAHARFRYDILGLGLSTKYNSDAKGSEMSESDSQSDEDS